jgi:hypothetical protein
MTFIQTAAESRRMFRALPSVASRNERLEAERLRDSIRITSTGWGKDDENVQDMN